MEIEMRNSCTEELFKAMELDELPKRIYTRTEPQSSSTFR